MATKNVSLRLNENTKQSPETSTVWVSGKTVYGHVITASTSVVQEALTYTYNVTTTQSGCKVVVGGLTLTESSSTNGTYTTSSVETSLSYTVSKYGYVTKTGTITGPNRSITVTLDQIVNETLTCNGDIQLRIQNNTQNQLEISTFDIVLNENGSEIASWTWQVTTSVDIGNHSDISPSMTSGMGPHTVAIGTTLTVTIRAQMTNGSATELEFKYPSFDGTFQTITSQRTGDFSGSKNLPTITYSGGSGYSFPTVSTDYGFKAIFSE